MPAILIVDDHPPILAGLMRYLGIYFPESDIYVASSGAECLKKLKNTKADVVILDINLPDITGNKLCSKILSTAPDTKIIALTGMLDRNDVKTMMDAGAYGYIVKTSITDEIVEGVEAVLKGEKFISSCLRNL